MFVKPTDTSLREEYTGGVRDAVSTHKNKKIWERQWERRA